MYVVEYDGSREFATLLERVEQGEPLSRSRNVGVITPW
jgi:hypothetical protein